MRTIDMRTWTRREHFEFFSNFNHPHFNMCANVDITKLYRFSKEQGFSLTAIFSYLIARTANDIPEFRQRIRQGTVIEHETVSPSITVLVDKDLFSFCTIDYSQDFTEYADRFVNRVSAVKSQPTLKDPPGRDDLLYMTAIPWVSFTSFTHPMRQHPADSIPRFAWGKYSEEGDLLKIPLSVQGHHALMDGIHMGKFYQVIDGYLQEPEVALA